jgi:signal transduction histidine kinase
VDAVVQAVQTPTALGPKLRVWRRPGLLLPLLLCGLTAFGFTELTKRAGTFNVSQVNQATQIIIFCLVASATYYLFRSIQLHKRDTALLQAVVDQETVAIKARDELIIHAAQALKDDLDGLGVGLASLGTARAVNFIRTGHGQLQELLRKFLLVAYLRGGRSSAPFSDVRLQDVLGEISRSLEPKAAAKRVTIVPDAANASLTVQEPTLLRFVLQSLMDNAVAYSAEGAAVHVGVSPESDRTLVTVTDSGASIPADKLQTIFQPFFKAEGAESFNHEGAGLSLYIDKLIMTYMGGLISVESAADKTAFTVSLPGPRSAAS